MALLWREVSNSCDFMRFLQTGLDGSLGLLRASFGFMVACLFPRLLLGTIAVSVAVSGDHPL
jgi:hypothetical protein